MRIGGALRTQITGLWRHPDFLKLWAGQTISHFGSQVTGLALPLTAALVLQAAPAQMGLLGAAGSAPYLLVGLIAGVYVDRLPRRPILIAMDILRAGLLAIVPVAAWLDLLRIELLYAVAFLAGVCTVFFNVASHAYLPTLVPRSALVEGNSKLTMSASAAATVGPGLAGALVYFVTAPIAIAFDALSFVVSALFLRLVRTPEPRPASDDRRRSIFHDVTEGLRVVMRHAVLRTITTATAAYNFFGSMLGAVYVLYVTRELEIGPAIFGAILSVGGASYLVGAFLAGRVTQRYGIGTAIAGAGLVAAAGQLLVPLAGGPLLLATATLVVALVVRNAAILVFDVNVMSLRQAITPDHLQGRVSGTTRFMIASLAPVGALLGGVLGGTLGLRPTLAIAVGGALLVALWLLASPWRSMSESLTPSAASSAT